MTAVFTVYHPGFLASIYVFQTAADAKDWISGDVRYGSFGTYVVGHVIPHRPNPAYLPVETCVRSAAAGGA
jgi:hypothetical protein